MRRILVTTLAAMFAAAGISTAAQADPGDLTKIVGPNSDGSFSGQDCPITGPNGSNGFSGCWATQSGVVVDPTGLADPSRSVAQIGLESTLDISTNYPTIDGTEFTLDQSGNNLLFTYVMGAGDPVLHYISLKQADGYYLFYDADGITSGVQYTFNLGTLFPNNIGISHVTVYDDPGGVPEPATWGLMLVGFAGVGVALRRSRRRNPALMQIA